MFCNSYYLTTNKIGCSRCFFSCLQSSNLQASERQLQPKRKESTPVELLMDSIRNSDARASLRKTGGPPKRPLSNALKRRSQCLKITKNVSFQFYTFFTLNVNKFPRICTWFFSQYWKMRLFEWLSNTVTSFFLNEKTFNLSLLQCYVSTLIHRWKVHEQEF